MDARFAPLRWHRNASRRRTHKPSHAFDAGQSTGSTPAVSVARGFEEDGMPRLTIRQGEWVVVCDGAKALVLENVGDDKFPNLKTLEVFEQENPATREQGTDKPGRMPAIGQGTGRASVGQTDWHDRAEEAFLTRLAERLDAAVGAGKTKSLIVIAPPRALGMLRPAYTHALKGAVRAELDKDLVKLPVHEIERHLSEAA
jgi:protein required for attachment to host cells